MKNRQDDIRRSPLQLSNCKNNCKLETRNKIETVVASRVLMNMGLGRNGKYYPAMFFALGDLGDPSSSSSSPSVSQRSKWRLLVCLKEQASTKIHIRAKIVRGTLTLWSRIKEQRKHQGPAPSLIIQGLYRHQALYARLLCKVAAAAKESTLLLSMCWESHQENAMPRPGI